MNLEQLEAETEKILAILQKEADDLALRGEFRAAAAVLMGRQTTRGLFAIVERLEKQRRAAAEKAAEIAPPTG